MSVSRQVTELREIAREIDELRTHSKGKVAAYYEGSRDILLKVAAYYEARCSIAGTFFQQSVIVREE